MSHHVANLPDGLSSQLLDSLPNPVLLKDSDRRYVWVNAAFERLFSVERATLLGRTDEEMFTERQAVQCSGGDMRVLEDGDTDEASEVVIDPDLGPRDVLTRKSRVVSSSDEVYLLGVMHDITDVTQANNALEASKQALEANQRELERLAETDPLTGCLNRRALATRAAVAFQGSQQRGGVIMLDLDHFKNVNDVHGHDLGDEVLRRFADILRTAVRDKDLVGRLGGEEFTILLPGASVQETEAVAERIRTRMASEHVGIGDRQVQVTTSAGIAHKQTDEAFVFRTWLAAADGALYQAKKTRNAVVSA